MAGPQLLHEKETTVDPEIREYLTARLKPLTPQQTAEEKRLIGKRVARRKSDAKIVAYADDYEALERELEKQGIDPNSVVRTFVDDPSVVYVI